MGSQMTEGKHTNASQINRLNMYILSNKLCVEINISITFHTKSNKTIKLLMIMILYIFRIRKGKNKSRFKSRNSKDIYIGKII